MNYILQKVNCKALIVAVLVVASTIASVVVGYAYTMRKIPNFWFDGKYVYVAENVSPRQSSYTSVLISYDNLADLVYYCNEHGLCATLAYNSQISRYVGYVTDEALDLSKFGVTSLRGLLGNVDGYVYVAERESSTSVIVNNFNQTIINNSSGSASGSTGSPYVSSSWQEKELLGKIYEKLWFINEWLQITKDWVKEVNYNVKNVNTNINNNVVPALVAINKNLSSMLTDTASRLSSIQSASWASVDAENRILSTLTGIGNQLGSVIRNGQIQVNTSPLEARLDKLISMYSKVNSVVLDTASVNGGQINGAVGGELKDVVFWGDTGTSSNEFLTPGSLWYRLGPNVGNTTPTTLDDSIVLRSVNLGSTIPSYIANDPVLYAGVWRKGADYIISDTYNASTGEYVQRVSLSSVSTVSIILDAYGRFVLSIPNSPVVCSEVNFSRSSFSPNASIYNATGDLVYMIIDNLLYCIDRSCTDVNGFVSKYSDLSFLYPRGSAVVQNISPASVFIPEGNSYILSYCVRITGKYETYDSYTQTADIITAINNIPPVDLDLTPLSSRLDTLNTTISSVISQGKLKVDNSAVVTALGKLDKLDELPTIKAAVDGVNTTIASVISEGRLKVDNSPVVTWLETINTTLTTNDGHSSTVDLSSIETTLSKICDKLDDAAVNVNNTVVNITNDNDKFNVFYITDVNGETQPITEFAGDLTGASGKLLSLLYRLVFADALGGVDDDFSGFEDFFTSQEPVTAAQGVDDIVSEVVDVWAS